MVGDIKSIVRKFKNITFTYYKGSANSLIDRITKKPHFISCIEM